MNNNKKALVEYQIEKAEKTFVEAKIMMENGLWSGATNRAYYACFYIVSAALLAKGKHSKTHKGTRSLFNQFFASTNEISKQNAKYYSEIFNLRQQNDYDFFIEIEPEKIEEIIESSERFITDVTKIINICE